MFMKKWMATDSCKELLVLWWLYWHRTRPPVAVGRRPCEGCPRSRACILVQAQMTIPAELWHFGLLMWAENVLKLYWVLQLCRLTLLIDSSSFEKSLLSTGNTPANTWIKVMRDTSSMNKRMYRPSLSQVGILALAQLAHRHDIVYHQCELVSKVSIIDKPWYHNHNVHLQRTLSYYTLYNRLGPDVS